MAWCTCRPRRASACRVGVPCWAGSCRPSNHQRGDPIGCTGVRRSALPPNQMTPEYRIVFNTTTIVASQAQPDRRALLHLPAPEALRRARSRCSSEYHGRPAQANYVNLLHSATLTIRNIIIYLFSLLMHRFNLQVQISGSVAKAARLVGPASSSSQMTGNNGYEAYYVRV